MKLIYNNAFIKNHLLLFFGFILLMFIIIFLSIIFAYKEIKKSKEEI